MTGSDSIYIVMPIIMTLALVVLIGLPFVGARGAGESHPGGGHPRPTQSPDAVVSGENTRRITSQPADGQSSQS